ncbi:site-specific integrase [Rhodoglobus aureus]|uniref:Tyrosine-type recombinase/integrase n=1 Tax=Rhodoglobus aureus TaxID=191497 RepID=A0ABP4GIZ8_9MICO
MSTAITGRGRPRTAPGEFGVISKPRSLACGALSVSATLRLPDGTTVRITGTAATATAARRDLASNAELVLAGWNVQTLTARTTFAELGAIWLSYYRTKGRAPQTVQRYESTLNGTVARALGSLTLGELDNGLLRRTVRAVAESGRIAEARACRVVIRAVLSYAVEQGAVPPQLINFDGFQLPTPLKKARAIKLPELENLRELITAHRDRDRPGPQSTKAHDDLMDCMDLILGTSLRISEVLAVHRDSIDLDAEHPTLIVDRKVEYVKGTGYRLGALKTDATARGIELPEFAVAILRRRFADGREFAFVARGGGLLSQNNIRRTLREVTGGSDLSGWLTPHSGRKTVATAVNNELGSSIAAEVLGQSDDRLIKSTYGERRPVAPNVTAITERFAPK